MDQITLFINQVIVLFLMLMGMFVGESVTSSLFGHIRGKLRRLLYLLFFVVFIVFGNYLPHLMRLPELGFMESILLFSVWGFLTVFFSRSLIAMLDSLRGLYRRLNRKKKQKIMVDAGLIIDCLQEKGFNRMDINSILSTLTHSEKKAASLQKKAEKGRLRKKIQVNPQGLTAAVHQRGLTAEEIVELLVRIFRITPEQAANTWRKST